MAPTMKYWKTRLLLVLLLLRYLLKSGMFVVLWPPEPRKGESKESEDWRVEELERARTGSAGSDERGRARSSEREVEVREAMAAAGAGCGQLVVDGGRFGCRSRAFEDFETSARNGAIGFAGVSVGSSAVEGDHE